MTLTELNYIFPKAHILMGVGCVLGEIIANGQGISCPWLLGCLMGLLFFTAFIQKYITGWGD